MSKAYLNNNCFRRKYSKGELAQDCQSMLSNSLAHSFSQQNSSNIFERFFKKLHLFFHRSCTTRYHQFFDINQFRYIYNFYKVEKSYYVDNFKEQFWFDFSIFSSFFNLQCLMFAFYMYIHSFISSLFFAYLYNFQLLFQPIKMAFIQCSFYKKRFSKFIGKYIYLYRI